MFELLDLANLGLPGSRREAALFAGIFSALVLVIVFGVFLSEATASTEPLAVVYRSMPSWLRWAGVVAPVIALLALAAYLLDVWAERRARRKIGVWPRQPPEGGSEHVTRR